MSAPRVAVVPVGRIDVAEVEAALGRVAKVLHAPVELRAAATLPRGTEDVARGQHDAVALLKALRQELPRLGIAKVVGADLAAPEAKPATPADAIVFVTDVDLFTPSTDAVMAEIEVPHRAALVSVRRLKEAFHRRKADPAKQRSRLVKEILRAAARIRGLPECSNEDCALAPTRAVMDLDRKSEHYCAPCWKRLSTGTLRI